jgi:uncharacterized protein (TIGR02246 family)
MNTRHSTLIGLLLLTVAAVPGCLSSSKKDNSYLNVSKAEHAAESHAPGQHGDSNSHSQGHGQTAAKPAGDSHGAEGHGAAGHSEKQPGAEAHSHGAAAKPEKTEAHSPEVTHSDKAIEVVAKTSGEATEGLKEPALGEKAESAEPKTEATKTEPQKASTKSPTKPLSPAEKAKAAKLKQDEDAVEAVATKWMALVTSGRSEAPKDLLTLYTKDAVFIGPDSVHVRDQPEDIRSYLAYFTKLPELAITGYQGSIRLSGDSAIETGTYTFSYKAGEKRETIPARFSIHYRRIDGEWKIDSHHSSRLPEASLKGTKES